MATWETVPVAIQSQVGDPASGRTRRYTAWENLSLSEVLFTLEIDKEVN